MLIRPKGTCAEIAPWGRSGPEGPNQDLTKNCTKRRLNFRGTRTLSRVRHKKGGKLTGHSRNWSFCRMGGFYWFSVGRNYGSLSSNQGEHQMWSHKRWTWKVKYPTRNLTHGIVEVLNISFLQCSSNNKRAAREHQSCISDSTTCVQKKTPFCATDSVQLSNEETNIEPQMVQMVRRCPNWWRESSSNNSRFQRLIIMECLMTIDCHLWLLGLPTACAVSAVKRTRLTVATEQWVVCKQSINRLLNFQGVVPLDCYTFITKLFRCRTNTQSKDGYDAHTLKVESPSKTITTSNPNLCVQGVTTWINAIKQQSPLQKQCSLTTSPGTVM